MMTRLISRWRMRSQIGPRNGRTLARVAVAVCRDMCETRSSGLGVEEGGINKIHGHRQTISSRLHGAVSGLAKEGKAIKGQGSRDERRQDLVHNILYCHSIVSNRDIFTVLVTIISKSTLFTRNEHNVPNRTLPLCMSLYRPCPPSSNCTIFFLLFPPSPRTLFLRRVRRRPLQSLCLRRSQWLLLSQLSL
jgi:hypothetical protein